VLGAIHGSDNIDATAVSRPFHWPCPRDLQTLRVGYVELERARPELEVLRKLGVELVPIKLPHHFPIWPMAMILNTEASAAFDELTRANKNEGLGLWPDVFRAGQFTPAVEYLRAQRIRTLLMAEMDKVTAGIDLYIGGADLGITNLTGHPTVVCPAGFRRNSNGVEVPYAVTFTGKLFGESELLSLALAYQEATDHHLRRPPLGKLLGK
jgi:Asp-tRNA(Asn)/Glu-tRNA(Gln) amidotransferase A subunit family amidase